MSLVEDFKETVKIIQKIDNLDLYKKILDLQSEVMDLMEENKLLKSQLQNKELLIFQDSAYWTKKEDDKLDGPFCPRCWDYESKLVRLISHTGYHPKCPQCKNFVEIKKNI